MPQPKCNPIYKAVEKVKIHSSNTIYIRINRIIQVGVFHQVY